MLKHVLICLFLMALSSGLAIEAVAGPVVVRAVETPISLTDHWKFQRGDNLVWARPECDDSKWAETDLKNSWGKADFKQYAGFSWYRLSLHLPWGQSEANLHQPIGITIGGIDYSCYEVYAGGELIGTFGSLPPKLQLQPSIPQTFQIPGRALDQNGGLTIAVRLWRNPEHYRIALSFGTETPTGCTFGFYEPLRDKTILDRQQILLGDLPRLICSVVFFLVGLYHLQLYRRRKQLREYLWFGLLTLSATLNIFFFSSWTDTITTPLVASAIGMFTVHFSSAAWFQFVWLIFGWKVGRVLRGYQIFQIALGMLTLLKPDFVEFAFGRWPIYSLLPIFYLWLVVIPREAWRGNPDARTITFGLACLAFTRLHQFLVLFHLAPRIPMVHWGFAALIFSMAVTLSNRFNRVYKELDALNQELENKVAERTAELAKTVNQLQISEKQAHQAEEAALQASRAKSIFLANMSHELRTPLNAILGFVQLMKRNHQIDAESYKNLDIITRSGEHLLSLINDILSISKIEAGQMILNTQPFDLYRMLESLEETFRLRAEHKNLGLIFELDSQLPQYVQGDEGKIRQILINLLGNALKFTEKGTVTLRAQWNHERIFFEVEDTGFGIAPEEVGNLFGAFSQTQSGLKAKEGTGLGLVISRNFARLMGGDITVSSQLGQGSVFSVELNLPLAPEFQKEEKERLVVGLLPGQPLFKILVADDVLENRQLLTQLLRTVGFQVQEAINGKQAVELWQAWHPHLILMDMRMPIMDGVEATRRIRSEEKTLDSQPSMLNSRCVIIALTASAFEHDHDMILESGCDDIVTKPFREETLFEKISQYLGVQFEYQVPSRLEIEAGANTNQSEDTFAQIADLSPELIANLNQVITEGDLEGSFRVIDKIQSKNPALASHLRSLIKSYRFDEILEALEKV